MKIDFDKIIEEQWDLYSKDPTRNYTKECMKIACNQVLDEAIARMKEEHKDCVSAFYSEEPILQIKEEL